MPQVPATRTPASREQIAEALSRRGLSRRQQGFLLAHILIETGRGNSIIQHNVGNLAASRAVQQRDVASYWRPPWFDAPGPGASERTKRLHELMLEGREPSAFFAYRSLGEGIDEYLELLGRERFAPMLEARTPEQFVRAWKETGYTPRLNVAATLQTFRELLPKGTAAGGGVLLLLVLGAGGWYLYKRYGSSVSGRS